ncbi:hypothetical protein E2C01_078818 [Portunus trituberculatus]|uniref:Uncharacterized protein n=1 Tax=Portunus trituberculatus TaxID=210409 RepID=A0A5B7IJU6_PORTR|nr:hypothetical protein [Portunus trituberculatus]
MTRFTARQSNLASTNLASPNMLYSQRNHGSSPWQLAHPDGRQLVRPSCSSRSLNASHSAGN